MAYTCIHAHGVSKKQSIFLTRINSARAHIVYTLTRMSRSFTLCIFMHTHFTVLLCTRYTQVIRPNQVAFSTMFYTYFLEHIQQTYLKLPLHESKYRIQLSIPEMEK
jgi:hypothetical protein